MEVDTKMVFRSKYIKKNSSRMPSWHPPDSESGMVQDDESTIKVHNDANACFFQDSAGLGLVGPYSITTCK